MQCVCHMHSRVPGAGSNYAAVRASYVAIAWSYEVLTVAPRRGAVSLAPDFVLAADAAKQPGPVFKHDARLGGKPKGTLLAEAVELAISDAELKTPIVQINTPDIVSAQALPAGVKLLTKTVAPLSQQRSDPVVVPPAQGKLFFCVLECTTNRGPNGKKGGRDAYITMAVDRFNPGYILISIWNGRNSDHNAPFSGEPQMLPMEEAQGWSHIVHYLHMKGPGRGAKGSAAERLKRYEPVLLQARGVPTTLVDGAVHNMVLAAKSKELSVLQTEDVAAAISEVMSAALGESDPKKRKTKRSAAPLESTAVAAACAATGAEPPPEPPSDQRRTRARRV